MLARSGCAKVERSARMAQIERGKAVRTLWRQGKGTPYGGKGLHTAPHTPHTHELLNSRVVATTNGGANMV